MAVTRQPVRTRFAWQVAAVAIVAVVALDRWVTSAHWVSDLVGGALFGGLVATVSLLLAGVHVPLPHDFVTEIVRRGRRVPDDHVARRAAVIYNPVQGRRLGDVPSARRVRAHARAAGSARSSSRRRRRTPGTR